VLPAARRSRADERPRPRLRASCFLLRRGRGPDGDLRCGVTAPAGVGPGAPRARGRADPDALRADAATRGRPTLRRRLEACRDCTGDPRPRPHQPAHRRVLQLARFLRARGGACESVRVSQRPAAHGLVAGLLQPRVSGTAARDRALADHQQTTDLAEHLVLLPRQLDRTGLLLAAGVLVLSLPRDRGHPPALLRAAAAGPDHEEAVPPPRAWEGTRPGTCDARPSRAAEVGAPRMHRVPL